MTCATCLDKGSIHGQACECRILSVDGMSDREAAAHHEEQRVRTKVEAEIVRFIRAWGVPHYMAEATAQGIADMIEQGAHRGC